MSQLRVSFIRWNCLLVTGPHVFQWKGKRKGMRNVFGQVCHLKVLEWCTYLPVLEEFKSFHLIKVAEEHFIYFTSCFTFILHLSIYYLCMMWSPHEHQLGKPFHKANWLYVFRYCLCEKLHLHCLVTKFLVCVFLFAHVCVLGAEELSCWSKAYRTVRKETERKEFQWSEKRLFTKKNMKVSET